MNIETTYFAQTIICGAVGGEMEKIKNGKKVYITLSRATTVILISLSVPFKFIQL